MIVATKAIGVVCPTCGLKVTDPKAVRCPRCFSPLVVPTGCTGNCARCHVAHKGCST